MSLTLFSLSFTKMDYQLSNHTHQRLNVHFSPLDHLIAFPDTPVQKYSL